MSSGETSPPLAPARLLQRADLDLDPVALARRLVGVTLLCDGVGGIIVETEAYGRNDAASHSFRGPTLRNRSMFAGAGTVYVYRSYGLHWCFNLVARDEGAVLIRAIEPVVGLDLMRQRRGRVDRLADGPGRLAQALAIGAVHDGSDATAAPVALLERPAEPRIFASPRIGISRAVDRPWRFGIEGSPWLSRRMPTATGADRPAACVDSDEPPA